MVQLLTTKLFIPSTKSELVSRPRLIEQLNEGLDRRLTLISAPAGFGKTTLLSEWVANCQRPVAWLSLDAGDNDSTRFLRYMVAALQTVAANIGEGVLGMLQSPQPPASEAILTELLNEITLLPNNFILVLDDYHAIDSQAVDHTLAFLIEHQPPQMHLVIATREDPNLPLARLRARGQSNELRIADLRFTLSEAAGFLNQVMGLNLSPENIAALEDRTEGWVAGLQLAAISMRGHQDTNSFIKSFTGSHHFVMDYLMEEVLGQQSESIQRFLLYTSILERLCGPLCDAILRDPTISGQETLEYLERANLFIIPLDNERHWYRYHHLFAELLRQRLYQSISSSKEDAGRHVNDLHIRASQWYEDNGLDIEAFHHAAAANDIERAERLMDGKGIPLHLRGAVTDIVRWLESLPKTVMDARPSLWWRHGAMLLVIGQTTGVEEKLDAAEAAVAVLLQGREVDEKTRNLLGQIASARSVLALTRYQVDVMLTQSRRALEYLHPQNVIPRATALWTMGYAYLFSRAYDAARQPLMEAISLGQASGDTFTTIIATIAFGLVEEAENQLYRAVQTYQRVLQLAGDQPLQIIYEAHLGMARVLYEWNNIESAEQYAQQSLKLARQYDQVIDRFIICEVFLGRLKLAQGDVTGASAVLAKADQTAREKNFVYRIPEVAAAQVLVLLRQGNLTAAAHLAQIHDLPLEQARVLVAQGDTPSALTILERLHQQAESKNWQDVRLRVMVFQAIALLTHGEKDQAVGLLNEALVLAEPNGFIRLFIDEGQPMRQLLSEAYAQGITPGYVAKLLAVFETEGQKNADHSPRPIIPPLLEPLSQRELEVLQLIAQGLSNLEISERLFLALDTVKGHNRRIYDKLQVQRRTEAVARARELGLL